MKKLLAVYNCCEIARPANYPWYANSIESLIRQSMNSKYPEDYQIVVSGCALSDATQQTLQHQFGNHISLNYIEDPVPLPITFNDTVQQCVDHFGPFESYLYIDSGVSFWDPSLRHDGVEKLWEVHNSNPNCMTAAMPSNDDGSSYWGINYAPDSNHVLPLSRATNLHCQIWSNEWREAYGKIYPDIFANDTSESVFSYMAAAIRKQYMVTTKVHVLHLHSLDGASCGQRNTMAQDYTVASEHLPHILLYKTKRNMDERHRDGFQYGMGYEGCKDFWPHDPDKFDASGMALDERFAPWIRDNLFLTPQEFDYSSLRRNFIGRK